MKGDRFPQGGILIAHPVWPEVILAKGGHLRRPVGGLSLARPGAARPRARVGVQDVGVPDGREAVAQRRRLRVELRQAEQQLEPAARRGQTRTRLWAQSGQTVKACLCWPLRCLATLWRAPRVVG